MLAADFFHLDCAVTLRRLYCLFVIEAGSGHPVADQSGQQIDRRPVLSGLINEYQRAA